MCVVVSSVLIISFFHPFSCYCFHVSPIPWYTHTERVRMYPNASECIRTDPNRSERVLTHPNTSPNLKKLQKTGNILKKAGEKLQQNVIKSYKITFTIEHPHPKKNLQRRPLRKKTREESSRVFLQGRPLWKKTQEESSRVFLQRKPLSNFGMKLIKSHDLWKTETEMELKKWRFSTSICIKYWIVRLRAKKSKILHSNLSLELGRRVEGAISLTISCRRSLFRKFCTVICPWSSGAV